MIDTRDKFAWRPLIPKSLLAVSTKADLMIAIKSFAVIPFVKHMLINGLQYCRILFRICFVTLSPIYIILRPYMDKASRNVIT